MVSRGMCGANGVYNRNKNETRQKRNPQRCRVPTVKKTHANTHTSISSQNILNLHPLTPPPHPAPTLWPWRHRRSKGGRHLSLSPRRRRRHRNLQLHTRRTRLFPQWRSDDGGGGGDGGGSGGRRRLRNRYRRRKLLIRIRLISSSSSSLSLRIVRSVREARSVPILPDVWWLCWRWHVDVDMGLWSILLGFGEGATFGRARFERGVVRGRVSTFSR